MQLLKNIRCMLRPCTLLATASSFIFLSSCANDPSPVRSSQPARLSASPTQLAVETPQSPTLIPSPTKTLAADLPITPKPIPPKPLPIPPTTEPEVVIRIETLTLNRWSSSITLGVDCKFLQSILRRTNKIGLQTHPSRFACKVMVGV